MGDFGCFFEMNLGTQATTFTGTRFYMSPQLLQKCVGLGKTYSAVKADVFSLGMTLYAMANLSPDESWPLDSLEETARTKVLPLPYTEALKRLLLIMVSEKEKGRPTMQAVLQCAETAITNADIAAQKEEAAGYKRALTLLQRQKTLLGEVVSAEMCLKLGQVYSRFGQWAEAEAALSQGLDLPASHSSLYIRNVLAETYIQRYQWRDCISVCEHALKTERKSGQILELQKTLYYLAYSHYRLGSWLVITSKLDEILVSDCAESKCLTLLITATRLSSEGNKQEACYRYEEGLKLARQMRFCYLFFGCCVFELGYLHWEKGEEAKAESLYLQCRDFCQTHFPKSLLLATCFDKLGSLDYESNRLDQAEQHWIQAKDLFQTHSPHSIALIDILISIGTLYSKSNKSYQAEQSWIQAEKLCQAHFPLSITLAYCFEHLGNLYAASNRQEMAEQHLIQAKELYQTTSLCQFHSLSALKT